LPSKQAQSTRVTNAICHQLYGMRNSVTASIRKKSWFRLPVAMLQSGRFLETRGAYLVRMKLQPLASKERVLPVCIHQHLLVRRRLQQKSASDISVPSSPRFRLVGMFYHGPCLIAFSPSAAGVIMPVPILTCFRVGAFKLSGRKPTQEGGQAPRTFVRLKSTIARREGLTTDSMQRVRCVSSHQGHRRLVREITTFNGRQTRRVIGRQEAPQNLHSTEIMRGE